MQTKQSVESQPDTAEHTRPGNNGNAPPLHTRFRKGQSGNPGGRPRDILSPLLRDLVVADDGRIAKAPVHTLVRLACAGNTTALRELISRVDGVQPIMIGREESW